MAIYIQFEKSPNLTQLITGFQQVFNPTFSFTEFVQHYMDLDSATGQGLDFWGQKLGLNRNIEFLITNDKTKFGFYGADLGNFSYSNFAKISKTATFLMTDEMYRKYLKLILLRIVTQPTGLGLVTFMKYFYDEAIVTENSLKVTIDFTRYIEMPNWEQRFLSNRNVVPIPAGIAYEPLFYVQSSVENENNQEGILSKDYYEVDEAREKAKEWVEKINSYLMDPDTGLAPIIDDLKSQGDDEFDGVMNFIYSPLQQLQTKVYSDFPGEAVEQIKTILTNLLRTFQKDYLMLPQLLIEKFKDKPAVVKYFENFYNFLLKTLV